MDADSAHALAHLGLGWTVVDPQGRITHSNHAFLDLVDAAHDQPLSLTEFLTPPDLTRVLQLPPHTPLTLRLLTGPTVQLLPLDQGLLWRRLDDPQRARAALLGDLAGRAAHRLNNLLTSTLGHASMAQLDLPPEHPAQPSLTDVVNSSRDAADLSRQLLNVAQPSTQPQRLTLTDAVQRCQLLLQLTSPHTWTIRVDSQHPDPMDAVPGDLQHLLLHLAHAAALHSPDARTLTIRVLGSTLELGPEPRPQPPFSPLTLGDVGAPLPLQLAERHGWSLSLSPDGWFRLELTPPKPHGILLVEDDPAVRRAVDGVLTTLGFRVVTAEDGLQAASALRQDSLPLHVALIDGSLRHLGGEDVVDVLRIIHPDLSVVVMSGYDASHDPSVPFLPKPFTVRELVACVRAALAHH